MKNFRTHGAAPYRVAVLHGGPGAPGEVGPVARELSQTIGVLEPFQTRDTIEGQVQELRETLQQHDIQRVTLIGWSWGAWLGLIFAARYPALVDKLLLISSGPFDPIYVEDITRTRLGRLTEAEKLEWTMMMAALENPGIAVRGNLFFRFDALFTKTDSFAPLVPANPVDGLDDSSEAIDEEVSRAQAGIYQKVWPEAAELRRSGTLLEFAKRVQCPVVAIHGDYDPHPPEGVRAPLAAVIDDSRFILLANCGHTPWIEQRARDEFYSVLGRELRCD